MIPPWERVGPDLLLGSISFASALGSETVGNCDIAIDYCAVNATVFPDGNVSYKNALTYSGSVIGKASKA